MIHLDASFLIRAIEPGSSEDRAITSWYDAGETFAISAVAWAEFMCGPLDRSELDAAAGIIRQYVDFTPAPGGNRGAPVQSVGSTAGSVRGLYDRGRCHRRESARRYCKREGLSPLRERGPDARAGVGRRGGPLTILTAPVSVALRSRAGGEQRLGVFGLGPLEDRLGGPGLHHEAVAQHDHLVAERADDLEVVADEEIGEAVPRLERAQEVDDLGLDRHVERRRGLVEHHQAGLQHQRAGDGDALALAAGELVRVTVSASRVPTPLPPAPRRPDRSRRRRSRGDAASVLPR